MRNKLTENRETNRDGHVETFQNSCIKQLLITVIDKPIAHFIND